MGVIVPAILPTSREDLEGKLSLLEGLVDSVQIDIVDGVFASPASWPYATGTKEFADGVLNGQALPFLGRFNFEIDLMVRDAEQVTGLWIAAGAQRLVIHAESTQYLPKVITDLQVRYGHAKDFAPDLLSFGLAVGVETDLSMLAPFMHTVDFVQFMGIASIGKQGQPFDRRVLDKIRAFRSTYPDIVVQVDGAVSLETLPSLLNVGVDRLIVGSGIWKAPNIKERLLEYKIVLQENGIYT